MRTFFIRRRRVSRPISVQAFISEETWLTELPGKLTSTADYSTDALPAPEKLGIINLVPEHAESAAQQLSRDRHFRFRLASALHHLLLEVPELFIALDGGLSGFD